METTGTALSGDKMARKPFWRVNCLIGVGESSNLSATFISFRPVTFACFGHRWGKAIALLGRNRKLMRSGSFFVDHATQLGPQALDFSKLLLHSLKQS